MRTGIAALSVLIGFGLSACGDDSTPLPTSPTVAAPVSAPALSGVPASAPRLIDATRPPTRNLIEIPAITIGGTIQLGSDCATPAMWASSNTAVATVTGGLVTGVGVGRAQITETCGGVTSTVIVEVAEGSATFAFDPVPPTSISGGETGHFRVNIIEDDSRRRLTEGVTSSADGVVELKLEGDRWRYTGAGVGTAEIRVVHGGVRRLTHTIEVTQREARACLVNPATGRPYGLVKKVEEHPRFGDDWLRVTYRWTNDCATRIRLYDMRITVWDSPDRTGTHAGRSYPDDIDIAGSSSAEVVDDVRLTDGVRAGDIEGPDNVRKRFYVRHVNQ